MDLCKKYATMDLCKKYAKNYVSLEISFLAINHARNARKLRNAIIFAHTQYSWVQLTHKIYLRFA